MKVLKKRIINFIKSFGVKKVTPCAQSEWKIKYGSCYFSGEYMKKKVFIKVLSFWTKDTYENEVRCSEYIRESSPFLYEKTPKIIFNCIEKKLLCNYF